MSVLTCAHVQIIIGDRWQIYLSFVLYFYLPICAMSQVDLKPYSFPWSIHVSLQLGLAVSRGMTFIIGPPQIIKFVFTLKYRPTYLILCFHPFLLLMSFGMLWKLSSGCHHLLSGVPDFFDRNKILSGYDLSHYQVPHCIRVFFYFVWFVFIHHNFQFYFKSCAYCNILDIYLS